MFRSCYQLFAERADKRADVIFYGHKTPVPTLLSNVDALAASFSDMGLTVGDVVTLYLPTCPQAIAAFYACSKCGLIANVVHPLTPLGKLKANLQATKSKVLLFYDALVKDERQLADFEQILVRCSVADYVSLRKPLYKLYSSVSGRRLSAKKCLTYAKLVANKSVTEDVGNADLPVCYMHSGGTGGEPKTVVLPNRAFNDLALSMVKRYDLPVESGEYSLVTLPVFHAYGLCAAIHAPLVMGFGLILVPKFGAKRVDGCIRRYNATFWTTVPVMLKKMLVCKRFGGKHLRKVKVIWCGGDAVDESLVKSVNEHFVRFGGTARVMRGYGLTETCGVCVVNTYGFNKANTCGMPLPGCSVQIVGENGNVLPVGQKGEIVVSSVGAMSGYLGGNSTTSGKIATGDIGFLDADGYLTVVDRKKRMVKIAAVNVFPSEVEKVILSLPQIDEACVVSVSVDGKTYLKAYVTLRSGADNFNTSLVTEICSQKLIKYAVPHFVEVLPQMPRTKIGKVDVAALQNKK